ncbi:cubilin, partial [Zootermopsis nevadensis]|uniref:cubilin n=1 Tax=Zootermopsis nevadensis TaxID=136037 RepID=UPI000B8E64BF
MVQETSAMVPSAVQLLAALFGVVDSHFHGGYTYDQPLVPFTERDNASTYTKQLSGDQCVASYGASQFRLQSPRFPAPYPPGLQCIYVVEAVSTDICLLQATFLTFDLGDCESGDHVIIAGQRLCGSVNGVQTFRFGRPRSLILFRTGAAEGRKGFDIAVRQVPCPLTSVPHRECSANFSGRSFVLQSTGYPASYPGNVHCQYVIRAAGPSPQQSLCQAAFSFESFNVDSSEGCSRDRLEIGDQDVLCGFFNGVRTYEFVGELRAHFYSDDFGNQGGYRISVVQQGCRILNLLPSGGVDPVPPTPVSPPFHLPLCCGKVYSGHQFFLASPGFPFSHANQDTDCVYEIHPSSPGVCKLRILFKFFRVGQEESYGVCSGGFLEIDGRQYCGCVLGLTVTSAFDDQGSGRQKALRYRNVANSGGFLLEVFQEDCTGFPAWVRQDTSGQFQQHYKTTSPYYSVNVGISNSSSSAIMADTRTEEQKTFRDPTSDSNANRSDGQYFRTLEQAPRVSGYPRETDGTGDKSLVFAVGATDRNK